MLNGKELKSLIREKALQLGFDDVGFARAEQLHQHEPYLHQWLSENKHGAMHYLSNHFEKRLDPTKLVQGTKTVIVFSFNYSPEKLLPSYNEDIKIARYAYGRDYHNVVKKKLKSLYNFLQVLDTRIEGRYFVDSAPILEHEWARRAGIGWTGKNTLTIHPKKGSYFFLATMLLNAEIPSDSPLRDHCGRCRRCIDACPTDAIDSEGYKMDASKCISYATIEWRPKNLPADFEDKMEGWVFGCDICQEVCPWNKFSQPHHEEQFHPNDYLKRMDKADFIEMDRDTFDLVFSGSAIKRTKFEGMKRNINFVIDHE